ncbi:MAG: arylsulfatase [Desulfofustis sp.]|nr:arylsulfatase [Desulfofustis sp.]
MSSAETSTRIVLIHATTVSITPIRVAFEFQWPEAETVNLVDDSLSIDLNSGTVDYRQIEERILGLAKYGERIGAAGILFTCSAFGQAIDKAKTQLPMPVLKPNEAMFEEAIRRGGKIGMIATFGPSIPSMEKEFYVMVEKQNASAQLDSILVEDAMAALGHGDLETHNHLIREASAVLAGYGTVMLAQFSASQAAGDVEAELGCTVLTSPHSAVKKLHGQLVDRK